MKLNGNWIWNSGEASPSNFYLYGRKSFELSSRPESCPVQVTGDSRYILYVNGRFAGRGPVRCDPQNQFVDTWDIAPHLTRGRNVIAALVHHYGEWTFAYIHKRGGFLLSGSIRDKKGTVRLSTDETWRVCQSGAWRTGMGRMNIQLDFPEDYDANLAPVGWTLPDYDDSAWEKAAVVSPAGEGPWAALVPRDIPPLMEKEIRAEAVLETHGVRDGGLLRRINLHQFLHGLKEGAVAYVRTSVYSQIRQKAEISIGAPDSVAVWFGGKAIFSHLGRRTAAPDLDSMIITLSPGWNRILAKVLAPGKEVPFYLRVEPSKNPVRLAAFEDRPGTEFAVLGAFPAKGPDHFAQPLAPETEADLAAAFKLKDGTILSWQACAETFPWHENVSVRMQHARRQARKRGRAANPAAIIRNRGFATVKTVGSEGVGFLIDFGREVVGFPRFTIRGARGGEQIELGYSELLVDGYTVPNRGDVHYADRYTARPGDQAWETFDKRAFRYLQLDVRNAPEGIRIGDLRLNFTTYDVGGRGRFECSDDRLNRIWEIGAYSVQLNMEDAYTDCPWRERAQWLGDARIEAFCNFYAFGDAALLRRGIRQWATSQTPEGMLQGCYPTGTDLLLPDFVLVWMITIHDYYNQTGDLTLFTEMLPVVKKALGFFERHTGAHGLLYRVPHWNFIDWAPMGLWGESAPMNGYYALALAAVAELAKLTGERKLAKDCANRAAVVRKALRKQLFVSERGLLKDCRDGKRIADQYSQAGNSLAVLAGVFTPEEEPRAVAGMLEARPDVSPVGTPFFAFYVLEAMYRQRETARALGYIRERWGAMMDAGATTWWEHWNANHSLCHGWGAGPTYFLSREVLGVKRAAPGWTRVIIEPAPDDLKYARGVVPAPLGDITAAWERNARRNSLACSLELPPGITADVLLPGEPRASAKGPQIKQFADGRRGWTVKGPGRFRFESEM